MLLSTYPFTFLILNIQTEWIWFGLDFKSNLYTSVQTGFEVFLKLANTSNRCSTKPHQMLSHKSLCRNLSASARHSSPCSKSSCIEHCGSFKSWCNTFLGLSSNLFDQMRKRRLNVKQYIPPSAAGTSWEERCFSSCLYSTHLHLLYLL